MTEKPLEEIRCVACEERVARVRGQCGLCYNRHLVLIKAGQTTWAELEQQGKSRPPRGVRWCDYWQYNSPGEGPQER